MPWTTPETFTAGQTLTAASMNTISGDLRMGGPVFTNEAARDAAITSPEEGMTAYLTAPTVPAATGGITAVPTGITTIYNGAAWVCITPVSAQTTNSGTTTSTSFTATLSGSPGTNPSVTLSTGTTALITISANISNNGGGYAIASTAVSGATTVAASDNYSVVTAVSTDLVSSYTFVITGLTAGSNTFTMQYRATTATSAFVRRAITVQGIA